MRYILILCALAIGAFAQSSRVETTAVLVPVTATTVASATVRMFQLTLHNKSSATVYCSVIDKQVSPLPIFGDGVNTTVGSIAAGTLYIMAFPFGRVMSGGITWSCSSGTAVVGTLTYDQ